MTFRTTRNYVDTQNIQNGTQFTHYQWQGRLAN